MTTEELQQYNNLSSAKKREYDLNRELHPNWSHNQIMLKLAVDDSIGDVLNKGNTDINPNNPVFLRALLNGAKEFLSSVGCVALEILTFLDDAIDSLTDLIAKGISWVGDALSDFWDWLNS